MCSASLSVPVLLILEPSCHSTHMAAAASTSALFALHVRVSSMEENKLLFCVYCWDFHLLMEQMRTEVAFLGSAAVWSKFFNTGV